MRSLGTQTFKRKDKTMANKEFIELLKARDTAMPLKRFHWQGESKVLEPLDICPRCEWPIVYHLKEAVFCPFCGQRLDVDNYAFE